MSLQSLDSAANATTKI